MSKNVRNSRILWMDILNITAIIGVVMLHCNGEINLFEGPVTGEYVWSALIVSLLYWPVNVFFMITGANLIGYTKGWRNYAARRFKRTVIPYLAWSCIYCLIKFRHGISVHHFAENILNGGMIIYFWYFIALFIVYLSIPFITSIVKSSSNNLVGSFLMISFLLLSIVPTICNLLGIKLNNNLFPLGSSYIMMAVAGYYITKMNEPEIKLKKLVAVGGGNYSFELDYFACLRML